MARKTKNVTIAAEGRDAGKTFVLTEMPATRAEKWAVRALLSLSRSGLDISDDAMSRGAAALIGVGLHAILSVQFDDAEPLLDEMMECVSVMPDPKTPAIVRPLVEDDTEEVATLLLLRSEVIELHVGFSVIAALSKFGAAMRPDGSSSNTSTSRPLSEPSHPVG